MKQSSKNRGIALPTAIAAALVVSITAALILAVAFRRFERSAFRSEQKIATTFSEAALNYLFTRLDQDNVSDGLAAAPNGLSDTIRYNATNLQAGTNIPRYVLSTAPAATVVAVRFDGNEENLTVNEQMTDGANGTPIVLDPDRDVHIAVELEDPGDPQNSRFVIHTSVDYGE